MKLNLLSKALPSEANDVITRIKLGRTLFGKAGVRTGILEDPWCQICLMEDNKETEDTLLHSLYKIILSLTKYFLDTIPNRTEFILGVTNSNIHQAIDRQQGCLLTSLLYNYVAFIITTKQEQGNHWWQE